MLLLNPQGQHVQPITVCTMRKVMEGAVTVAPRAMPTPRRAASWIPVKQPQTSSSDPPFPPLHTSLTSSSRHRGEKSFNLEQLICHRTSFLWVDGWTLGNGDWKTLGYREHDESRWPAEMHDLSTTRRWLEEGTDTQHQLFKPKKLRLKSYFRRI